MPDTFTPEQISQILEEFFKVVGTRQYIGARYVPIFGRKGEESIEWDNTAPYEPLTIVLYQGNSYTSRQFVPVGVEITNQEFWAITGNYNAQVEQYRRETAAVREIAEAAQEDINELLPKADFSAENTVKKYVDRNKTRVLSFDTVADMQNSSYLESGMVCRTNGFHAVGDEGAAYYTIATSGAPNGMDILNCQNDLIAQLVIDSDSIKLKQLGAIENSEVSTFLNRALELHDDIYIDGAYLLDSPIVINKACNIRAGKLTCTNSNCFNVTSNNVQFHDMRIESNSASNIAIYCNNTDHIDNISIINCAIVGFATGLHFVKCWNVFIEQCTIDRNKEYGIVFEKQSVNNHIVETHITTTSEIGGIAAIYLNGKEQASEGITISDILTYRYQYSILAYSFSHIELTNSILDYNQRTGIELNSVGTNACVGCIINGNYIGVEGDDTRGINDNSTTKIIASGTSPCNIFTENKILNYKISSNSYGILVSEDSHYATIANNVFLKFNSAIVVNNDTAIIIGNQLPIRQGTSNNINAKGCIVTNNNGDVYSQIAETKIGKNKVRNIAGASVESLADAIAACNQGDIINYGNGTYFEPQLYKVVKQNNVAGVVELARPAFRGAISRQISEGTGEVQVTFPYSFYSGQTPLIIVTPQSVGAVSYTVKSVSNTGFILVIHSMETNSAFYWCAMLPTEFKTYE